ncbi:AP complex, mu/sigma subunit [Syncephalastrum racemosum]|uniref:AP complex subunit sigma n=1 Tax=Syncephalastrum racemosum TaxID=13706 RepID=A0A1X2H782_SYNRA|nr:AP complex, mu/sigma subunit [Syncephalastrum racemosum]
MSRSLLKLGTSSFARIYWHTTSTLLYDNSMIQFVLIVNRRGQTRFARYYTHMPDDCSAFELSIAQQCLVRKPGEALFLEIDTQTIVYRVYGPLYFIVGCDQGENVFAILELIQYCVELLDRYFEKVTELDLMCGLERVTILFDEVISGGHIVETDRERALAALAEL